MTLEGPSPSENESSSQGPQPESPGEGIGKAKGSKCPRGEPTGYMYRNRAGVG